jgi:hypothetical protein
VWLSFLLFTVLGGAASIYSAWFQKKPLSSSRGYTQPASINRPQKTDGVQGTHSANEDQSTIDLDLALIPIIQRIKDANGVLMKGGQNDIIGVLRIRQHKGKSAKHVRSLQITGTVAASSLDSYQAVFSKGDGTESLDDIEAEYENKRPFFRLSWISYPLIPIRIDQPEDEEFGKFAISQSGGAIEFAGDAKDYFGFRSTNEQPKYPQTTPVWSLLVHFNNTSAELAGLYPE